MLFNFFLKDVKTKGVVKMLSRSISAKMIVIFTSTLSCLLLKSFAWLFYPVALVAMAM